VVRPADGTVSHGSGGARSEPASHGSDSRPAAQLSIESSTVGVRAAVLPVESAGSPPGRIAGVALAGAGAIAAGGTLAPAAVEEAAVVLVVVGPAPPVLVGVVGPVPPAVVGVVGPVPPVLVGVVGPVPPVLGVVVAPVPLVPGPFGPDPVVVDVVLLGPDPVVVDVLVDPDAWWVEALARAASSSARAIGPAVEEPVVLAGWLSTDTATTATGSCAGANATSQSSFVSALPCCAVPVFAATSTPGIATLGAVPPGCVTPSIKDVTDEAVVAGTARRHGWGL